MEYCKLPIYQGGRNACARCLRPFRAGEVLTVADDGALTFCYSDADGGCLQEYLFFDLEPKRALFGEPQVFVMHGKESEISRPDPPPTLGSRLRRFFGPGRS